MCSRLLGMWMESVITFQSAEGVLERYGWHRNMDEYRRRSAVCTEAKEGRLCLAVDPRSK